MKCNENYALKTGISLLITFLKDIYRYFKGVDEINDKFKSNLNIVFLKVFSLKLLNLKYYDSSRSSFASFSDTHLTINLKSSRVYPNKQFQQLLKLHISKNVKFDREICDIFN